MRRLTLLLSVLLVPSFAAAQSGPRYERPFLGGTITAPILAPTDCATAVSYGFTAAGATAGLCRDVSGNIIVQSGPGASAGKLVADVAAVSAFFFNASNQASGMQAVDGTTNFYVGGSIHAALTAGNFAVGIAASTDRLRLVPGAAGAGAFTGDFTSADLTGARTWTMPDATGDVAVISSTGFPVRTAAQSWATRCLAAGTGISIANACGLAGNITVSVDTTTTPQYSSGTAAPPATCATGEVYAETDQLRACICSTTNTWTCNGKLRAHATDCTSLTDGIADEMCFERDANTVYVCDPTAGGCDTAGEWIAIAGGSGAPTDAKYIVAEANGTLSAEVAPSAANQVPMSSSSSAAAWVSAAVAAATFDATVFHVRDEFFGGYATALLVGDLSWRLELSGTGSTVFTQYTYGTNHPGLSTLSSGTSDNAGALIWMLPIKAADLQKDSDLYVIFGNSDTAVTDLYLWVGFQSTTDGVPSSAVRVFYDTDLSHTNFIYQICDSSTTGCQSAGDDTNADTTDSGVAVASSTWYTYHYKYRTSGVGGNPTVYMQITGGTEKTFCSSGCDSTMANFPTADMWLTIGAFSRATTSRTWPVDLMDYSITVTR